MKIRSWRSSLPGVQYSNGVDELYDDVIAALNRERFAVQDTSLSASQVMAGPRGGDLDHLEIQAEVAARIYTSDILIAPSRPAVTRSEWVMWEVQLAAIGYGIPILFVDEPGLQRRTGLVSQVASLGLAYALSPPETQSIAFKVAELAGRPDWAVRRMEAEKTIRYRGPPMKALDAVFNKFPFRPLLTAATLQTPPKKAGLWGRMTGKG